MTDFRALCAELADELTQFNAWYIEDNGYGLPNLEALLRRCDAALAKPEPEGPTREDAVAAYSQVMAAHQCETLGEMAEHFARAVLARWGTPNLAETRSSLGDAPQPVPVSERLPGLEDCDAEEECYWFDPKGSGAWYKDTYQGNYTHWLPAHALPLPTAND